ncbi:hypothetical protein CO044_01485 [Candidatus Peregrinibacteria bacterium CG_4_9_14_0_2_um_filter_38_9]|nr:MAG: hypothetical protein CO044_01485 [Candidatus Peregrinibacteria bacterium CG_4_9_14_0_2_um_filter_38_9]
MEKICTQCQSGFEVTQEDLDFLGKVSPIFNEKKYNIPAPTLCVDCRHQRRQIWRNERVLYKRKCSATGKPIISVYSEDKPFPVYENEYWYSDKWDPMSYGRDFDFSKTFLEQFKELMHAVPQLSRSAVSNDNSDYVNQAGWCRNCYLIFEADHDENCLYSSYIYDSKFCMDMTMASKCQLCYESIDCENCYNLKFSQNCKNSSDSWFLKNCIGCKNCYGCVNLRNKEYFFLNEKLDKESYEKKTEAFKKMSVKSLKKAHESFLTIAKKYPQKYFEGHQNEDVSGNYISNCKNCSDCYDINNSWDCKHVTNSRFMKNCQDITVFGSLEGAELCYECHETGAGTKTVIFSDQIWTGCYNISYSKLCMKNSHDLFGCIGLKHKSYCILNKQYSEKEYNELVPKIIAHMEKDQEFGEFFPKELAPYSYNETVAQDYYPLSKEDAINKGYTWRDPDKRDYLPQTYVVPEYIDEVKPDITAQILACETCKKNYKITEEELNFYKKQLLPIPNDCHDCRHKNRFNLRTQRHLYKRNCQKCNIEIQTTFKEDSDAIVYCEKCYSEVTE